MRTTASSSHVNARVSLKAGAAVNAGESVYARLGNVKVFAEPRAGARVIATMKKSEEAIASGEEKDGFIRIDGDNAAAYRYTEARLTAVATQLMAGLDEGTVGFRPTYNGEEEEPEVFPGLFPNLLANGASGIAVGMATSIPPHNVAELIDAATHLIDYPKA